MPEDPIVPPVPDNAAFAALRTQAAAAEQATREALEAKTLLETELNELKRRDMTESERIKAELEEAKTKAAEADTLRNQAGQFQSAFQAACDEALGRIPEAKRGVIADLTVNIPLADRLGAINRAMAAFDVAPTSFGTQTQPGLQMPNPAGAPDAAKPMTHQEVSRMSWTDALGKPRDDGGAAQLQTQITEMQQQIAQLAKSKT